MCCETETQAAIRSAGLKLTAQRLQVACAVRHAEGHITAGEVMRALRPSQPVLDVSTVYRSLAALRDAGLVTQTEIGGEMIFEWGVAGAHHHLICSDCGAMTEVGAETLAPLVRSLRVQHRFEVHLEHLALGGLCADCVAATP